MEPTNYLRQILLKRKKHVETCPSWGAVLNKAIKGEKFMLPDGGRIINKTLEGLPDKLRLPYKTIVLEYKVVLATDELEGSVDSRKLIVANQVSDMEIEAYMATYRPLDKKWVLYPYRWSTKTEAIPEDQLAFLQSIAPGDGRVAPFLTDLESMNGLGRMVPDWIRNSMNEEVRPLMELLEALSCSNVGTESLLKTKPGIGNGKKDAYPFDSYRVLTINSGKSGKDDISVIAGSGRSPREHLRRGHIRVYRSGIKVWIQPMVVNPGQGGKSSKDYFVT